MDAFDMVMIGSFVVFAVLITIGTVWDIKDSRRRRKMWDH